MAPSTHWVTSLFLYSEAWQLFLELNDYKEKHIKDMFPQGEEFNQAAIESLENFNIIIDSQYSKMIITKLTENIEMIVMRSKGDPGLIEILIEKIINACVSYGMLGNLDNLLVNYIVVAGPQCLILLLLLLIETS